MTDIDPDSAAEAGLCRWCGASFTSRAIAGREQRFCSQICQRAARNAGRRRPKPSAGDAAAELLDELLLTLLELPPEIWETLALSLPAPLFERVDQWIAAIFDEGRMTAFYEQHPRL